MSNCTKCVNRGARNFNCIKKCKQLMTPNTLYSADEEGNNIKCVHYKSGPQSTIYIPRPPIYSGGSQ
jgi:hypothetical protein